ncbi:MAG: ribosome biogenesis factor YjgA [Azovibrio sp.]
MHYNKRNEEAPTETGRPSKTQVKQAMLELQELGESLVALSKDQLKRMGLDEDILEATLAYQRFTKFEAKRRQLQYIGKLMRNIDPEPIRQALAAIRGESSEEIAKLHRLERLRTRLLENEAVANEIAQTYPQAELTRIRQLRRAILKEQAENKPPKNFRELFQYLKELESEEKQNHEQD